ncbi:MAG TPA: hypothetical protein VFB38_16620 [Chthonomonadaceae bacterium]|nr:hypothetical protein [Chthonomonadaceae bacterium]
MPAVISARIHQRDGAIVGSQPIANLRGLGKLLRLPEVPERLFWLLLLCQLVFAQPEVELGGFCGG